jgi:hypothetical protein
MTLDLDRMIRLGHEHAKAVLIGKKGATLPPTFVISFKNRPPAVICTPWGNAVERNFALGSISMAMKLYRSDITGYSVVSEAWVATQDHEPRPDERPPAERDDRREVVFVCATDGQDKRFKGWEIERGPDAVVTKLVQTDELSDLASLGGRLTELLE